VQILICDDHTMFAECLADLLRAGGHGVITTATPSEARLVLLDHQVDVCLMDLAFPGGAEGLVGIRTVGESSPETATVVLTGSDDPDDVAMAREAGAAGFVAKVGSIAAIEAALARARSGRGFFTEGVSTRAAHGGESGHRSYETSICFLTARERETLERLCRGETTSVMAHHMGVSQATARSHVQRVLMKLGVHSRLEAIALATHNGLVGAEAPGR